MTDNDLERLETQAVDAAVAHKWEAAIELNKQILEHDPHNISASLRLGFSYLQHENIKEAKKYYQKVIHLQPKNPVATENLERISILEESGSKNPIKIKATLDPNMFLEVPGKTKSVSLVNLGQKNHLAELDTGEKVDLKLRKRKIEVRTLTGEYIGYLPDDVSKRMISFIEADSTYDAYVKEANSNKVIIFVREEKKGAKVAQYSSFPSRIAMIPVQKEGDDDDENEDEGDVEEDEWSKLVSTGEVEEENKTDYPVEREEEESEE